MSNYIKINGLPGSKVGDYVCYPSCSCNQMQDRITQLEDLGVDSVSLGGPHVIMGYPVLGKGHVGVVLKAIWDNKTVALKARRTDADRNTMKHEALMLEIANSVGVGPQLYASTKDFIVMEKIEGKYFREWAESVGSKDEFIKTVRGLLWKVYRLDQVGLDHGELNKIRRHFIVSGGETRIIDFESASTNRRVQNVTSTVQSIFLNQRFKKIIKRRISLPGKAHLIESLRRYKEEMNQCNFNRILTVTGLD